MRGALFGGYCLVANACRCLLGVCWSLLVVCCVLMLFAVCWLLIVRCCSLFAVRCALFVGCLCVVCWLLSLVVR